MEIMENKKNTVKLKTYDGEIFDVDILIAHSLGPVADALFACGEKGLENIPLANVESRILIKIIEWIEHHTYHTEEPKTIGVWVETFLQKLSNEDLVEIIRAANYLNVHMLFQVSCEYAATQISELFTRQHDNLKHIQLLDEITSPEELQQHIEKVAKITALEPNFEKIGECSELAWTNRIYKICANK